MQLKRTLVASISGPSGVGKSTLVNNLMSTGRYHQIQNWTTRPPRGPSDTDYQFCSQETFNQMLGAKQFISIRQTDEGSYGLRVPCPNRVNLAIVDPNGAQMIRDYCSVGSRFNGSRFTAPEGVMKVVHFLLDAPRDVCEERILKQGGSPQGRRFARLGTEFGGDGKYKTHPLSVDNFIYLDGRSDPLELKKYTAAIIEEILARGGY